MRSPRSIGGIAPALRGGAFFSAITTSISLACSLASTSGCGGKEPAEGTHVVAPAPAAPAADAPVPAAETANAAAEPPKGVDAPAAHAKAKPPAVAAATAVAPVPKPKLDPKPAAPAPAASPAKPQRASKPSASHTKPAPAATPAKPPPPAPVQPPAEPAKPAAPAPAAKPARSVVVPHTDHVRFDVPKGLQADLDADPRMLPWLGKTLKVVDTCYASTRSDNPNAEGVIPIKLTMHANERPDADIGSVPGPLSSIVGCATMKLLNARPPLFTGKEGEKYTVKVHFEK